MKRKSMVVIGMVVGCLMMFAGAAWAGVIPGTPNGTITVGNLVWLKNAGCLGKMNWNDATARAKSLKSGDCGLTDGSKAGDWRLPTIDELVSISAMRLQFSNVQADNYWSSTTIYYVDECAWGVPMGGGSVEFYNRGYAFYVLPVRSGP